VKESDILENNVCYNFQQICFQCVDLMDRKHITLYKTSDDKGRKSYDLHIFWKRTWWKWWGF